MTTTGILYIDCPAQDKNNAFNAGKELSESEYVKMLREYSTTIGVGVPKKQYTQNMYNSFKPHGLPEISYKLTSAFE